MLRTKCLYDPPKNENKSGRNPFFGRARELGKYVCVRTRDNGTRVISDSSIKQGVLVLFDTVEQRAESDRNPKQGIRCAGQCFATYFRRPLFPDKTDTMPVLSSRGGVAVYVRVSGMHDSKWTSPLHGRN